MKELKMRTFINNHFYYWGFIDGEYIGIPDPGNKLTSLQAKLRRTQIYTGKKNDSGQEIYENNI